MIEIRCDNNKKHGEVDPRTLSLTFRCRTCSDVWGRPVFHRLPIGKILNAIGAGVTDGVVYTDSETVDAETEPHRVS